MPARSNGGEVWTGFVEGDLAWVASKGERRSDYCSITLRYIFQSCVDIQSLSSWIEQ